MKINFFLISFFVFCKIFSTDLERKINQEPQKLLITGKVEIVQGVLFDEIDQEEKLIFNHASDDLFVKVKYTNLKARLGSKYGDYYDKKALDNFDFDKVLTKYLSIYNFFEFRYLCYRFYFVHKQYAIYKLEQSIINNIRYDISIRIEFIKDSHYYDINDIDYIINKYRYKIRYENGGYIFNEPNNCCDYTCCCMSLGACPSCPCKNKCVIL